MIEQRSPEWYQQRLGKLTASCMGDMLATIASGKPAASRANLLAQLVCERLTGKVNEMFESSDMRRGRELEPAALAAYEAATGAVIMPASFVDHPTIRMFGASPDGLIADDGLVETKCLNAANHIAVLKGGSLTKYLPQVYTQMACAKRSFVDLTFYHPDFPESLQLKIFRISYVPAEIAHMEGEAERFLAEVESEVRCLQDLALKAAA